MLNYKAIGRKISSYRKNKHYTQSVLAEQLNISESYMSQIECGKADISLKRLDQIAELFEIDIAALLSDTNIHSKNYGFSELFELTQNWSPEQKELLIALVRCTQEQFFSMKKK